MKLKVSENIYGQYVYIFFSHYAYSGWSRQNIEQ